jgi:hypothetical protein
VTGECESLVEGNPKVFYFCGPWDRMAPNPDVSSWQFPWRPTSVSCIQDRKLFINSGSKTEFFINANILIHKNCTDQDQELIKNHLNKQICSI